MFHQILLVLRNNMCAYDRFDLQSILLCVQD